MDLDTGYVTSDMGEAAYLILNGHVLEKAFWDQATTGGRMCFWKFEETEEMEYDSRAFDQHKGEADPKRLVGILDGLKRGMFRLPDAPSRH